METGRTGLLERLGRLEDKYRILADLRGRRDRAERSGARVFPEDETDARSRSFREIAREFPGSLRELEHSTLDELEGRRREVALEIQACGSGAADEGPARIWVAVVLEYHATLREALAIKMWLARNLPAGTSLTDGLMEEFRRWHQGHPARHSPTAAFGVKTLERYRRPPGGRLHAIVWERLGVQFHLERGDLEQLVFRPPLPR